MGIFVQVLGRLFLLISLMIVLFPNPSLAGEKAKNIIFMVPDGMGLADVTAARIYKNGPDGPSLALETLERIGYQRTYSRNSTITDSAPASSAWACGEKFNNGEICFHRETPGGDAKPTILEVAKSRSKATGLVATSQITHATPAAFAAHVVNRNCQNEIARQYVQITRPDLLLGGGKFKFDTDPATDKDDGSCPQYGQDLLTEAAASGYRLLFTKAEMDQAVASGATRLLGLFSGEGMTPEVKRSEGTTEPRLPEMTTAALAVLEKNPDGFFLMVEGSQIDWANHVNDFPFQLGEVLAFDDAVQVVLDWIQARPERKEETLLIVVADHETGGFAINGPQKSLSQKGSRIDPGWTGKDHTGGDVLIWSQGPGSRHLARPHENTALYRVMIEAMDGQLDDGK